jgi:glucosamine--fructose-6-phosphate aminotransferase (isomerizing)
VGVIAEANCHPLDSRVAGHGAEGIIHVCLNGDIDNYLELKAERERDGNRIAREITTDTKIIPLQIEVYLRKGYDIVESFRMAVNDFKGSHAISMHTDLAPGRFFLAQKGSGQAVFIGIAEEHYMPTSEVYGFVEETSSYIKMNGETAVNEKTGEAGGQIVILNQQSAGGLSGIEAMHYDGTPISLAPKDIQQTRITSRDIDRQGHPHYFFKEIMESPASVEKTIQNRWKHIPGSEASCAVFLDEAEFPAALREAFAGNRIRRIFFVGQGTAGVAAQVCADILHYYLNDPGLPVCALKSSELSGFRLVDGNNGRAMSDTLVVAITQSGTTTDTNRAVDMVRARGAHTLAIVNRRDSDVTFKVNGVVYTSSGRDIEMSVASTKAFYSQIVAGALVALYIAQLKGARDARFVTEAVRELRELPGHMRTILSGHEKIAASAKRLAVTKTYWATVGSGPNKASADEIRIKLSELCYKTISSDFIEDKKHIDLSSEPLILVCAAGVREAVIGDIIKDTAIFRAHKATPLVIADEGDHRFDPYAVDVFHVPRVSEQLAPVVNTLVGHIWGYYAALAINEGSRFLFAFRQDIEKIIREYSSRGLDIFEIILEKRFREKIARFDHEFRRRKAEKRFPTAIGFEKMVDLTLLLKYLAGKLPVSEFEMDFGAKGKALNIVNTLMECMAEFINAMARPVDAIKHQAKTVTVGTSRISEKIGGILFDKLAEYNLSVSRLTPRNILVLRNLQEIVSKIEGEILYRISGLNLLGEPTEETAIQIIKKSGSLALIPSRVETDTRLKGTKRIIIRQGNVYIGRGRKDDRKIIVIPLLSEFPAPPVIDCLLLLNFDFKENVSLDARIKALGGKCEHIKNIVQENSIQWDKAMIDRVKIEDLFGISAEKIAEQIIAQLR